MTCPYCKRDDGHYVGCQGEEKEPGPWSNWVVIAVGLVAMLALLVVLRLVAELWPSGVPTSTTLLAP